MRDRVAKLTLWCLVQLAVPLLVCDSCDMPLVHFGWRAPVRLHLQIHGSNGVVIICTLGIESWSGLGTSGGNGAVEELQELVELLGWLQMFREEIRWILLACSFA